MAFLVKNFEHQIKREGGGRCRDKFLANTSECCFSLLVRISSITLWITILEIGLVIDVDYHFGNRLGIGSVTAPSITNIVTELEIRTTITRMVIVGNETRNTFLDYQNGN